MRESRCRQPTGVLIHLCKERFAQLAPHHLSSPFQIWRSFGHVVAVAAQQRRRRQFQKLKPLPTGPPAEQGIRVHLKGQRQLGQLFQPAAVARAEAEPLRMDEHDIEM